MDRPAIAYGLISRFIAAGGASSPTSVAAAEKRAIAVPPHAAATGARYECSFFERTVRRKLMPQTCSRPGKVAQRLERDRELGDPATLEPAHLRIDDGVPVHVERALVADRDVVEASDRRHREQVAVAVIVKRVETDAKVVLLSQVRAVATHVVGHDPLGMRVPASARDIQVVVVEEHPGFGLFSGWSALDRLLLNEVTHRLDLGIHRVVQPAVQGNGLSDAGGSHRQSAIRPDDHVRRYRPG